MAYLDSTGLQEQIRYIKAYVNNSIPNQVDWSDINNVPTTFTPSVHNQTSDTINAMTGYSKASSVSAISTSDTLNAAIGKLEKAIEEKSDTTNSAGAANSTSKLFLVGTTSQATGTTYSNANVYAANGALHATSINTGGNVIVGGTADTNYLQLPSGIKLY